MHRQHPACCGAEHRLDRIEDGPQPGRSHDQVQTATLLAQAQFESEAVEAQALWRVFGDLSQGRRQSGILRTGRVVQGKNKLWHQRGQHGNHFPVWQGIGNGCLIGAAQCPAGRSSSVPGHSSHTTTEFCAGQGSNPEMRNFQTMSYWNQANFESLQQLAELLREEPVLCHLGQYADLRERGLKKAAQAAVQAFLAASARCTLEQQRALAARVMELSLKFKDAHQWPGFQVSTRFLGPVLEVWDTPEGRRCHALWRSDVVLLEASLAEFNDAVVRQALVSKYLDSLRYSTHHLQDGGWLGDLEVDRRDLERLEALAPELEGTKELRQRFDGWVEQSRKWAVLATDLDDPPEKIQQ